MNVRPLYDRVLARRIESEERSAGGLYLPEAAQEKPSMGMVLAVGGGRLADDGTIRPLAVSVGDQVFFGRWAGTAVQVEDEEFLILKEDEILGIIEG